jgi:hypothetical protein
MLKKIPVFVLLLLTTTFAVARLDILPISYFENKYSHMPPPPTDEGAKLMRGLTQGIANNEDAFRYAIKNPLSYFTQTFLKNNPNGSEFRSIYLVVDSDRLINGIKAGNALSLLKLKELSFQDKYIDGLYRKQTKDSKLLNNSMVQDRLYAKAKNKVHLYNSHKISYDDLIKESRGNIYLRGMIMKSVRGDISKFNNQPDKKRIIKIID